MKPFMQFISIAACILFASTANAASVKSAFELYDEGQYAAAYQEFSELLPLASPVAALQMSFMTLDEQGTDYDPAMAFSLASLAAAWGHPGAQAVAAQIKPHLTSEELQEAAVYQSTIESRQVVFSFERQSLDITPMRERPLEILERPEVGFPRTIANRYRIGWYRALFLVSKEGEVVVLEDAGAPVTRDFRGPAHHEIKRWRYHPMETAVYTTVLMDYFMKDSGTIPAYLESVHRAWDPANKNSAEFQLLLGRLLLRLESYAEEEASSEPKKIEFVHTIRASQPPEESDYLSSESVITFPVQWKGAYWLNMAARNGSYDAQFSLAIYHEEWMRYLVSQDDVRAKTWYGAELASLAISEEDREYGLQLLREARDSGDKTAIEVAAHFL
jgi:hypothetical protein